MNPNARELYDQAYGMEPAARDIFLAQACGDGAELRLEVQRMLVDADSATIIAGSDLDMTIMADPASIRSTEQKGVSQKGKSKKGVKKRSGIETHHLPFLRAFYGDPRTAQPQGQTGLA